MKSVSILGATGTIGQNCLKVIDANPTEFRVEAITANSNTKALAAIARQTGAAFVAIADASKYSELKEHMSGLMAEIAAGEDAVCEAAAKQSDILVAGIVGAAGLKPTLSAVRRGARVALANKECLVCAGSIFMREAADHNATIIPVDSEHNAIFQILQNNHRGIESITLTASGGPFRERSLEQMATVTKEQAVKHPNWDMGAKISVDSATMVNKGLELIEAMYLFALPAHKLKILVHPQSVVHGLVSYTDGSVLAQLSEPDMRVPLAYAMGWPKRVDSGVKPISLADIGTLEFSEPDLGRFPALAVALEAMQAGGSAPTVLNAANEVAVEAFLKGSIGFLDIASTIEETLSTMDNQAIPTLSEALHVDRSARQVARKFIAKMLLAKAG